MLAAATGDSVRKGNLGEESEPHKPVSRTCDCPAPGLQQALPGAQEVYLQNRLTEAFAVMCPPALSPYSQLRWVSEREMRATERSWKT